MLPPLSIFQQRIKYFKGRFPCSTFDEFWEYKQAVEKEGHSILDDDNLGKTARRLEETLLWNPEWGLAQTGIPKHPVIKEILRKVAPDYAQIRHIRLGEGNIGDVRRNVAAVYEKLRGITNARRNDNPVDSKFLIVGKAKVLMFMWGQTPGFDSTVRENFNKSEYEPKPYHLPHRLRRRHSSDEFCDIIEELDRWVQKWPASNSEMPFQSLCAEWPVGRIIDVTYYEPGK